eukprot:14585197-Alexandrium_andersonii.AAC.1
MAPKKVAKTTATLQPPEPKPEEEAEEGQEEEVEEEEQEEQQPKGKAKAKGKAKPKAKGGAKQAVAKQAAAKSVAQGSGGSGGGGGIDIAESKRMNGKMKSALAHDEQAHVAWQKLCDLPSRGAAKNSKKRIFLFAWHEAKEKDGKSFGESFWSEIKEMVSTDTKSLNGIWVTKGRLGTLVGHEEAEEMVDELKTKNAAGRTLYFYVEEGQSRKAEKKTTHNMQNRKRITQDEKDAAEAAWDDMDIAPAPFDDALGDEEEEEDEGGQGVLKRPASALAVVKGKGKGKGKGKEKGTGDANDPVSLLKKNDIKLIKAQQKMSHAKQILKAPEKIKYTKAQSEELGSLVKEIDGLHKEATPRCENRVTKAVANGNPNMKDIKAINQKVPSMHSDLRILV